MVKTINSILLIDDDDATNFYNQMVLEEMGIAKKIYVMTSAEDALLLLKTPDENNHFITPNLIILDINMPGMDGWEFLEHYESLEECMKAKFVIAMLTTSLNPDDKEKASQLKIQAFMNKPLEKDQFLSLLNSLDDIK